MCAKTRKTKKSLDDLTQIEDRAKRLEALINLCNDIREKERRNLIPFNDFLFVATRNPDKVFRNIFQLFYDFVFAYIPGGIDEYQHSNESIGFKSYDSSNLFINDCDDPFFADRLFINRFINLVKGFRKGNQSNRLYFFEGPPGSGKSTFLKNLLAKLEDYTKTTEGTLYKTYWHIDTAKVGGYHKFERQIKLLAKGIENKDIELDIDKSSNFLDIPCPNNDHPILQIPKSFRRKFLEELITDEEFKDKLFNSKEYEWVLNDIPCSICNSISNTLMDTVKDPLEVFNMINARRTDFNRQFGKGISVYNPGDMRTVKPITNRSLQEMINDILKTDEIKYLYSDLANTNNGVLALMDIKEYNVERLRNLHGIISDGIHKVEFIEERIRSLFVGLVNPEDKKHYENVKSFKDRIISVKIPYILDYKTEVSIYKNKFGNDISEMFLPRILDNFAKIIISSRLQAESPTIKRWLTGTDKYKKYIDKDLLLLKMEIYTGRIPDWLTDEDVRRFDKSMRKELIESSEEEGYKGFSGRQSLNVFNTFFTKHTKDGNIITMDVLKDFFKTNKELTTDIPEGFIESIERLYDYNVLQEVKEAIYYYNKEQISKDIQNYLYAVNFDPEQTIKSIYTNDKILVSEDYFKNFEAIFLGTTVSLKQRHAFRREVQSEYVSKTLSQDIKVKGMDVTETDQFKNLFSKYTANLKENALAPFNKNDNFRRALQDYNTDDFKTYDDKLKRDVKRLINNLTNNFGYTEKGAQEVSLYVTDKNLVNKY